MRLLVALCMLSLTVGLALGDDKTKIVCYLGSWAVYRSGDGAFSISDIDPTLCTHLIYSVVKITDFDKVQDMDEQNDPPADHDMFVQFVELRELSPETKFMASIGGVAGDSLLFSEIAGNSTSRSIFIKKLVEFTLYYNFDGVDLDWEYPNEDNAHIADLDNLDLLLKEVRESFDEYGLILTVAVAMQELSAKRYYNVPEISKHVDFINFMGYDFFGAWWPMTANHNAPLYSSERDVEAWALTYNIDAAIDFWLEQGTPPEKIILGMPFYGRTLTLADPLENEPGSPITGVGVAGPYTGEPGILAYFEICGSVVVDLWTTLWDKEQGVPYAYLEDQWLSFDNLKSITEKAEYVKKRGLGGAMAWSIDMDDIHGICREPYPLLNAMNRVLRDDCPALT